MTRVLRRWGDIESTAQPSNSAMTPAETVALKIYSIELKNSD